MRDWLADLREEKEQALMQAQARLAQSTIAAEQLRNEQDQILSTIRVVAVEPLLLQFQNDILKDHPLLNNPFVSREVFVRTGTVSDELKVPAPWSGSLENNSLNEMPGLPNGNFVVRVNWRLALNLKDLDGVPVSSREIVVSFTASGGKVNEYSLPASTPDDLKFAIVKAFREVSDRSCLSSNKRIRPHKHHSRSKRLWRSIFPASLLKERSVILIVLLIILLAIIMGLFARQILEGFGAAQSALNYHTPALWRLDT